jgi:hypothetical protein
MDTLRTTSVYFYSMVTLFISLSVNRGKVPQILRKFSENRSAFLVQVVRNSDLQEHQIISHSSVCYDDHRYYINLLFWYVR